MDELFSDGPTTLTTALVPYEPTVLMDSSSEQDDMTLPNSLSYVTSAIIGPIFCFLGMVGNALSVAVWTRSRMKCSTALYLTGQSVADLGVLVTFLLVDSVQVWSPDIKYSIVYGVFFSYLGHPFMYMTALISIWITMGVTVDRYIMVCWVTKAKRICSERHTKIVLVMTSLCIVIVNIPNFMFYTPVYDNEDVDVPTTSATENLVEETTTSDVEPKVSFTLSSFGGSFSGYFFEFWIHCIMVLLIPWVTVFTLNLLIIRKIIVSNKKMMDKKTAASSEKSRQSENQITRLLLTVSFSFLFFMGFQCIIQCIWMQRPPEADWAKVTSSYAFGKLGIVFTSSMNFIFYCMTGRRFRKELFHLCGVGDKNVHLASIMGLTPSSSARSTNTSGI